MTINWGSATYLQRQHMRPNSPIVARFVAAAIAAAATPDRCEYTIPGQRMEFTIPPQRMEYTVPR